MFLLEILRCPTYSLQMKDMDVGSDRESSCELIDCNQQASTGFLLKEIFDISTRHRVQGQKTIWLNMSLRMW